MRFKPFGSALVGLIMIGAAAATALSSRTTPLHPDAATAAKARPPATSTAPSPVPTLPSIGDPSSSPLGQTAIFYSGALNGQLQSPVVTCYPLQGWSSSPTMIVIGTIDNQRREVYL